MNLLGAYFGYLAGALLAILPIVNPFGAVPLVMSVAAHLPEAERLRQIRRACVYTFFLMSGFLVAGGLIMNFFGISIPGMRIAGGLIVAFLGFQMLFPSAQSDAEAMSKAAGTKYDIAFTPLAMPGLSGPGTFAVVMSLSSQAASRQGWHRIVNRRKWTFVDESSGQAVRERVNPVQVAQDDLATADRKEAFCSEARKHAWVTLKTESHAGKHLI